MNMLTKLFALSPADGINLPNVGADKSQLNIALSVFFAILGAISILIIVIAGIRYIAGQGEPKSMATAKNTIIYAVVGLVVATTAFIIVNFVLASLV